MTKQGPNKESFCRNIVLAGKCQLTHHIYVYASETKNKKCDEIPKERLIVFVVKVAKIQYKQRWGEPKRG